MSHKFSITRLLPLVAMLAIAGTSFGMGTTTIYTVPGKKIENRRFTVNPTPQEMTVCSKNFIDISKGFNLSNAAEYPWLPTSKKGKTITLAIGGENVPEIAGAYTLTIDKKGITINGFDETGVFYGMQTLRQLLESPEALAGKLPYMTIKDFPTLEKRGVVEGFYGNPWSHDVRLSLIDFYGRNKMNYYVYGPKDDPYHSSPNWRLPYPADEAAKIRELADACLANKVNFVWAIHPGKDIQWNEEDYQNLVNKFNAMYDLGVRGFAIFFDDIDGEGANQQQQVDLLNRLQQEFVAQKKDVANLIVCPTDYSRSWIKTGPDDPLPTYGKKLDKRVNVFYTGDVVCSDLTKESLWFVQGFIKQPPLYWWNFPVNDYVRHKVLMGPVYGLDKYVREDDLAGILSNPMEYGQASKIALYGVADYAWNPMDYNALDNWERAIPLLVPEAPEAFRTFCINNADTEGDGYRRDESWEARIIDPANYCDCEYNALLNEFAAMENAAANLINEASGNPLVAEMTPWILETGKLGAKGRKALELLKAKNTLTSAEYAAAYKEASMTPEDLEAYNAHKVGGLKMYPFYLQLMEYLAPGK